jgi:hypothetical protein
MPNESVGVVPGVSGSAAKVLTATFTGASLEPGLTKSARYTVPKAPEDILQAALSTNAFSTSLSSRKFTHEMV